jgi:uncharacterized protein
MGIHSVAESRNRLSELIDRALDGESVVITRHGRTVVELKPVRAQGRALSADDLDWLATRRAGRRTGRRRRRVAEQVARRSGEVSLHLDASVLVALFSEDALTAKADSLLRARPAVVTVSDFAAAEFASAIARLVRTREPSADAARGVFSTLDAWTSRVAARAETTASDVAAAAAYLRRLDLTLRTPDALNIAIAQRLSADLPTFDQRMAASVRALGTRVAPDGP